MLNSKFKHNTISRILFLFLCFSMLAITPAFATTDSDDSLSNLKDSIANFVSDKSYQTTTGGYLKGSSIVNSKGNVVSSNYAKLTSSAKQQLITDMNKEADSAIANSEDSTSSGAISEDTKSNWLTELENTDGIGSELMTNILSQTKPDFVKANKIYKPFASPIGTALALFCIVIGGGVTLTMANDLAWMVIPFYRAFTTDGGDGKESEPKWISFEARSAVKEAEGGDNNGKGTNKIAVLCYLKKRWIGLTVLGVCLLYLVQGEVFKFVSMVLNLLSGFLGF